MLLREARRARRLSVRAAGRQLGVSGATVSRIESGEDLVVSNAVTILRWLDLTPSAAALEPLPDGSTDDPA
jgi:transcriptional regulator with XRE-family HTH domain